MAEWFCNTPDGWHWCGGPVDFLPVDHTDEDALDRLGILPCVREHPHIPLRCTRPIGHGGRHAAGCEGRVYAVWSA